LVWIWRLLARGRLDSCLTSSISKIEVNKEIIYCRFFLLYLSWSYRVLIIVEEK
jgi:hypothetical protein